MRALLMPSAQAEDLVCPVRVAKEPALTQDSLSQGVVPSPGSCL